jgi:hypothetical protein
MIILKKITIIGLFILLKILIRRHKEKFKYAITLRRLFFEIIISLLILII